MPLEGSGASSNGSCALKTTLEGYGGEQTSSSYYGSAGAGFYGDGADDISNGTTDGEGGLQLGQRPGRRPG